MLPETLTTIGLVCDAVGAVLVATEVVSQFKGATHKTKSLTADMTQIKPEPTDSFIKWESLKLRNMRIGLYFLLGGFFLQGIATWMPFIMAYLGP